MSVRFPADLLEQAKTVLASGESLNDLVVGLVEQEVRRRRGLAAHERIVRTREDVLARTGPQPSSTPWIRALREGECRHD